MTARRIGGAIEPLLDGRDLAEGDKGLSRFARNLRMAADLASRPEHQGPQNILEQPRGSVRNPIVVEKAVFGPVEK